MGSPGVFIHSGILGGRLSASFVAANAALPERPPATTTPPNSAPPSRSNRRRDVRAKPLPMSVGSVIACPPLEIGEENNLVRLRQIFQKGSIVIVVHRARRRPGHDCRACPFLPSSAADRN